METPARPQGRRCGGEGTRICGWTLTVLEDGGWLLRSYAHILQDRCRERREGCSKGPTASQTWELCAFVCSTCIRGCCRAPRHAQCPVSSASRRARRARPGPGAVPCGARDARTIKLPSLSHPLAGAPPRQKGKIRLGRRAAYLTAQAARARSLTPFVVLSFPAQPSKSLNQLGLRRVEHRRIVGSLQPSHGFFGRCDVMVGSELTVGGWGGTAAHTFSSMCPPDVPPLEPYRARCKD